MLARNYGSGPKWVPATVEKVTGPVSVVVQVKESSLKWRRHLDQVRTHVNSDHQSQSDSDE